jgi:starch synthase
MEVSRIAVEAIAQGLVPMRESDYVAAMAKSPSGNNKASKKISSSILPSATGKAAPAGGTSAKKPASGKIPPAAVAPAAPVTSPAKSVVKKKPEKAAKPAPLPAAKTEPEPVSPKAKVRIALASQSAARAGRAMLTPSAPAPVAAPVPSTETKAPETIAADPSPAQKRILFIASECTPLAQTGGLGDMVSGLSKALKGRGHDVRIVMPLYQSIDRAKHGITFSRSCCVHFGLGEEIWVGVFEGKLGNVPIWFIDYARYFDRPYIYDDQEDSFRFGVLSKAALQVCKDTAWIPHVAHVHDWMTAMSAVFLKTWDRVLSPLSHTASVLTIHNIGYQGKFGPAVLPFYGLGGEYMQPDRLEDFGMINLLKAGIQYADAVTTVSPTYANEIRGPIGGMGLAPYLINRGDRVSGVLNGVDLEVWNPATDKYLPANFSVGNMAGKAVCKQALQERFGLPVDPKVPLFAIISRFAPQKGFDLIRGALPQALRDMIIQVVVLGTGDPFTENFFRWLHGAFPKAANAHIGFDAGLSHLMEAGADFFIMPSLYEPCGLNQMYSSLYGALPIVRATGGLDDTVENYEESAGTGTGFKFWEISGRALFYTLGWAVSTWYDRPHHYDAMQKRGMARDFSWGSSARQYEQVYEQAIKGRAAI